MDGVASTGCIRVLKRSYSIETLYGTYEILQLRFHQTQTEDFPGQF